MSHGSNPKDVWSTVEKNIMAIVVNKLEFEMRSKTSDEILKNASPIKNSVDDIIKEAEAICSKFGVILKTVKVGDINYSKEIAKARSVAKEVKIINQSIRETMNEFNIKDAEKAMSHVRVVSGNSSGLEINLTTPGGSQGNYTFNVSAGATNNKSKKENDKGKDEK